MIKLRVKVQIDSYSTPDFEREIDFLPEVGELLEIDGQFYPVKEIAREGIDFIVLTHKTVTKKFVGVNDKRDWIRQFLEEWWEIRGIRFTHVKHFPRNE